MSTTRKTLLGSFIAWFQSLFGREQGTPSRNEDAYPPVSNSATATDLSDGDLRDLTRMLPDFIDSLQHRERGDEAQAALSMLAALPIGGNPEVMNRNANRITWATAVHGIDRLKDTALLARDSADSEIRKVKKDELADLLRIDDVDERTDAILEKLQQGQMPTTQEFAILKLGAELMRSDSPTGHGK